MKVFQKELVLLPFPFSDLESTKVRPAIIVSNDFFNKKGDDCLMAPLTTIIKDEPYSILLKQEDLISGRLIKPSRIRLDKIFSVQKDLISMRIGKINDRTLHSIKKEIDKMF